jgi:hypothetical protein
VLVHDMSGEYLGRWHLPVPVELGDLAVGENGPPWRVASLIEGRADGPDGVHALVMCVPDADENEGP